MACPSAVVSDAPLASVRNTSSANDRADWTFTLPLYSATAGYQPPSDAGSAPPFSCRA